MQTVFKYFFSLSFILLHLVFTASSEGGPAGQSKIDSLRSLAENGKEDSNKVKHLNKLSQELTDVGSYDTSLFFSHSALELAQKLKYRRGIAETYGNIGTVYFYQGDFPKTLEYWIKALKTDEELGNKFGMAKWLGNIGSVYKDQGKFEAALDYYFKSLKFFEELGDKNKEAAFLGNIGTVYFLQDKRSEALDYYSKAFNIKEELGDKAGMAIWLGNIGQVYKELKDDAKALDYYLRALKLDEEIGDKNGIASDLGNIGSLYLSLEKYDEAEKQLLRALEIDKEIGALHYEMQFEKDLSVIYTRTGKYELALEHYRKAMAAKDSLFNQDKTEELTRHAMNYEFEKKDAATKAEHDKKMAVAEADKKKQTIVIWSVIVGLVLVVVFATFVVKERKKSEKLLLNILPAETARELKVEGKAKAKHYESVSVMFTDFKGFTSIAETLSAEELVGELDFLFKNFDRITSKYNIEKIKTIGDAYMCASGLPTPNTNHAEYIVKASLEIQEWMIKQKGKWQLRIGIHSGPVTAGVVGDKKFAYDIWGDTVNTASRMESSGEAGKINISGTTYKDLKGLSNLTGLRFMHRGKISAKNKGEIDMYFVERNN